MYANKADHFKRKEDNMKKKTSGKKNKSPAIVLAVICALCVSLFGCASNTSSTNANSTAENAGKADADNASAAEEPGGQEAAVQESQNETEEPTTLRFELDNGILEYKSYQYAGNGFYGGNEGDPSKTIILEFEYTNKSDQPRGFTQDFWLEAFQNGAKLSEPGSYSPAGIPKSVQDAYNPIGKGSSAVIGQAFVLQDYSSIHIEVKNNGGSASSQSMRLEIEPYEDKSFDINRLYGSWEDENSDKILTLTSSFLEFGNSKSRSSTQYPRLWTDGNTLHTNFDKLGDTLEIIEDGDTLRLVNDTVNLVQTENWPENGAGDEGADAAANEPRTVSMDEGITLDFTIISFDEDGIEDEIKFSTTTGPGGNSGGNITHTTVIESESEGTRYIYVKGTIENRSTSKLEDKNLKVKLILDDKYELNPKITLSEGGSSKHSIDPMNKAIFCVDASISDSVANQIEKAVWYFGFEEGFSAKNRTGDIAKSEYYYQLCTIGEIDGADTDDDSADENSGEHDDADDEPVPEVKREHEAEYTTGLTYNNYDCVRIIQEALNDAGYSCGTPDGVIGDGTRGAIRDYQGDHGLEETGEIDDELIDVLGCWDEADLCFYLRTTKDREGKEPASHFGKSDQWHHWLSVADRGIAKEINYYIKCESTDGFVYYPTPSVTIDAWGNPALAFDLWFDNPGNAPSTTITTTISDENEKVLAKIRFSVG